MRISCAALPATVLEIGVKLVCRICPFGVHSRLVQLGQSERYRGRESVGAFGQIEVQKEEGVVGKLPESLLPRLVGGVAQNLVGAGKQRVFEYVDGGTELLPDDRPPTHIC